MQDRLSLWQARWNTSFTGRGLSRVRLVCALFVNVMSALALTAYLIYLRYVSTYLAEMLLYFIHRRNDGT